MSGRNWLERNLNRSVFHLLELIRVESHSSIAFTYETHTDLQDSRACKPSPFALPKCICTIVKDCQIVLLGMGWDRQE